MMALVTASSCPLWDGEHVPFDVMVGGSRLLSARGCLCKACGSRPHVTPPRITREVYEVIAGAGGGRPMGGRSIIYLTGIPATGAREMEYAPLRRKGGKSNKSEHFHL
jgi:hypothetical protein